MSPSPFISTNPHAVANLIARQTIADDARNTLSSWDSCMSKAYCKWPVVAVIIIGSLIVLSLVFCIARFCCCGMECCCWCCSCFNRCCPSPRSKRDKTKYVEAPQQPMGYGYQQPMQYGGYGGYNQPQFATYDLSKGGKVQEDSLPAMPSWAEGNTRRVEEPSDEKAFGHEGGIAMGAMGANPGKRTRDDDPVYREDDQAEPMLGQQGTRSPSNYTDRASSPNPYAQQTGGYMAPVPENQQMDDNYAAGYGYSAAKQNPYAPSTAYAPSSVGGSFRSQQPRDPAYNYDGYNQETSFNEPQAPSSMYSAAYTPSRAPTYSSRLPPQHSTVAPLAGGAIFNNTNYGHEKDAVRAHYNHQPTNYDSENTASSYQASSTAYAPTPPQSSQQYTPFSPIAEPHNESAELPGSLSIRSRQTTGDNAGAYYLSQEQGQTPMHGAPSVRRKPVG